MVLSVGTADQQERATAACPTFDAVASVVGATSIVIGSCWNVTPAVHRF